MFTRREISVEKHHPKKLLDKSRSPSKDGNRECERIQSVRQKRRNVMSTIDQNLKKIKAMGKACSVIEAMVQAIVVRVQPEHDYLPLSAGD